MNRGRLLGLLLLIGFHSVAQETQTTAKDTTNRKIDVVFSLGGGIVRYMGDVQDASDKVNVNLLGNRPALDVNVGLSLSRSFTLNLNAIYGKLSGNENTFKQHRNFQSEMVLAGVNVEYNFAGAWKKRTPILNPFLTAGAYYGNYFNVKTDLFYGNNNPYYYWSDGKIRELEETEANRDLNLAPISRDYEYETSLVKGSVQAFTASAGLGLDLHLSRAVSVRLMSRYFFAVNDNVDGYSAGDAAGMSDGFFFNQLSLVFNTMAFSKKRKDELPSYRFIFDPSQLQAVEKEDGDKDGVPDMTDFCASTPAGVKVGLDGCPLDSDADGIPDYRDKQKNSAPGAIVDRNGVPVDYKFLAELWKDTMGVYRIEWNRSFVTGELDPNEGYTVNIKTVKKGSERLLNPSVGNIQELRKKVINDSLILFTLGVYNHFEEANTRSQELGELGENKAYGVLESRSVEVAQELYELSSHIDPVLGERSYGIQHNLEKVRTSEAYKNPTLGYSIERIAGHLDNDVPEYLLVKDFLNGTVSFVSDPIVEESYTEVRSNLDKMPIEEKPEYVTPTAPESEPVALDTARVRTSPPIAQIKKKPKQVETPVKAEVVSKTSEVSTSEKTANQSNKEPKITIAPVKPAFKKADLDGDGFLSSTEIERILEEILEGRSEFMVSQFNEMVQYYTYYTSNADPIDFGGTEVVIVDGVLTILKKQGEDFPEESRRILAKKYKEVDLNSDGDLTPEEVQKMITLFMEGNSTYSAERIYELIDLYFD